MIGGGSTVPLPPHQSGVTISKTLEWQPLRIGGHHDSN